MRVEREMGVTFLGVTSASALAAVLLLSPAGSSREPTVPPNETVIRLRVQPMAAPKPALRYGLLPELKELTPGNPIEGYLRCVLDQRPPPESSTLSLATLKQADRAARMDKPDWQLLPKLKTDGIGLLLPDIQKLRELASSLQTRFRDELRTQRFDDAIVTAKTMFALARHLGEHPTLIGNLVGIAISFVCIAPLEEMLEQPGCPNLYWALTNLPSPLVGVDKGTEGERALIQGEFRDLDPLNPMSAGQIKKFVAYMDNLRYVEQHPLFQPWLDARVKDEALLAEAKSRLVELGIAEERLSKFPPEQILLLDQKRQYEVRRDDIMKYMNLPMWQFEQSFRIEKDKPDCLFDFFLPRVDRVKRAQGRLVQRIALLQHVEAIRIHAFEHKGQLPQKLDDIALPLPMDPFTGKPFRYQLEEDTAHLRGTPPEALKNEAAYNLHLVITIKQ